MNAEHETGTAFLNLLPDTSQKYLGLYQRGESGRLEDGDAAQYADGAHQLRRAGFGRWRLRWMRREERAAVDCGGDRGLHAAGLSREERSTGCQGGRTGEDRHCADWRRFEGEQRGRIQTAAAGDCAHDSRAGRRRREDTLARISAHEAEHGEITDAQLVEAIAAVLLTEAFNHKSLQPVDGRLANGMSVMAMAAHTGCNTVYGSTAPNNPHPYPWMNSLFQDGITIGWLMGESFIVDHARRSVFLSG